MGRMSFGEAVFLLITARRATPQEALLLDAVLVSLIEHGLTPSAVVSRVTYSLVPESIQGAVAAGLLGVGGVVLGSMEDCGRLLTRIGKEREGGVTLDDATRRIVEEYRAAHKRVPGVGHALHTDGDPRAERLLAIAEECRKSGAHVEALRELTHQNEVAAGRRMPINVTGAVAAVLLELDVPWQLHRGFALVSRTAGLVAHISEEMDEPLTPAFSAFIRSGTDDE